VELVNRSNRLLSIPSTDLSLPDGEVNTEDSDNSRHKKPTRKKGKRGSEDDSDPDLTWLGTVLNSKDKYLPPSAKTIALKAKILNWINDGPNDKIISEHSNSFQQALLICITVFTQWRVMAKILGLICAKEEWGFCKFTVSTPSSV
jgi:hypothetical protein